MTAIMHFDTAASLGSRRLAISNDAAVLATVAAAATANGWPAPETASTLGTAIAAINGGSPPALLIVDLDALHDGGATDPLEALATLAAVCLAETRVLAVGSANDVGLFRALLAAGVGDYLVKPLLVSPLAIALRGADDAKLVASPASDGRVVAVIGVRGGCGATTIATSLAWLIANDESDDRCIFVDFDLHHGTAAMTFMADPGTSLAAMLASPERIDEQMIVAGLHRVSDRLNIIASLAAIEQDVVVVPVAVQALVAGLRTTVQWVVADLPHTLDPATRQLLRTADTVVMVSPPSLEGVRDSGRMLAYLMALRAGVAPLIVVNGVVGDAGEIGRKLFEDSIGTQVTAWIPTLWDAAVAAAANGQPLASYADTARQRPFAGLMQCVTGRAPVRPQPKRWWRR